MRGFKREGGLYAVGKKGVGMEVTGPGHQLGVSNSRRFPWPWQAQPEERLSGVG